MPKTTVRVIRDAATGRIYLTADDDLRPKTARIYTSLDGLRLREALGPDDTILEHRGEKLADPDPSDGTRAFLYTVIEYSVEAVGGVAIKVVLGPDLVAALPIGNEDLGGFGYGVCLLVEEWVGPQDG